MLWHYSIINIIVCEYYSIKNIIALQYQKCGDYNSAALQHYDAITL